MTFATSLRYKIVVWDIEWLRIFNTNWCARMGHGPWEIVDGLSMQRLPIWHSASLNKAYDVCLVVQKGWPSFEVKPSISRCLCLPAWMVNGSSIQRLFIWYSMSSNEACDVCLGVQTRWPSFEVKPSILRYPRFEQILIFLFETILRTTTFYSFLKFTTRSRKDLSATWYIHW